MSPRALTLLLLQLAALGLAAPAEAQRLRSPVGCERCIASWFYFDHAPRPGETEDFACERSTYDGHRGTDFSLRGGLAAIDDGHDVLAAADGVVVSTQDGHFDRCEACGGSGCGTSFGFGYGNHVVVSHGGYRVIYAHLRTGSVRVAPGDRVACGAVLGQIGSSGCSTGPHLHFEVRPRDGATSTAFDPFAGACSPTASSRWTEQGAHRAMPGARCDDVPSCAPDATTAWTCDESGLARRRCVDGVDEVEPCDFGCDASSLRCADAPDRDGDGATADVDCDDDDPSVRPGALDPCGNGVDEDCSGGDARCDGGAATDAAIVIPSARPRGCSCGISSADDGERWLALIALALWRALRRRGAPARATEDQ